MTKNNQAELRAFTLEARAATDERGDYIEGLAVVYNSQADLGAYTEIIEAGALNKTDLKDVRFLINHDMRGVPLARSRKNTSNSTMQLTINERGLNFRAYLDIANNVDAKKLYSAIERGDISGVSFMFFVGDEEWENLDSEKPTRRIKEISSIVEISAVTVPAYESTEIFARSKSAVETARRAVETSRSKAQPSVETDVSLARLKAKYIFGL